PNVDVYHIPFDTVAAYKNKARMVYEFDAGDVLQSYMYPAMARSFRTAGFQWATQFAYDPMATSYANTEYQTHYLNLAYTPSKAISKLAHIAGVGSSPVVTYGGSGSYFLDKLSAGVWRLEAMPDAVSIRDPFEKTSPQKEVTRIEWNTDTMQIALPDLTENFF